MGSIKANQVARLRPANKIVKQQPFDDGSPAVPMSPVECRIESLAVTAKELQKKLYGIEERLSPVLRPGGPVGSCSIGSDKAVSECPLLPSIQAVIDTLNSASAVCDSIVERLDI